MTDTLAAAIPADAFASFGLPTPIYRIGDTVYLADTDYSYEKATCPDCLGAKVWELTTPAGETLQAECPRCSSRYSSENTYEVQLFRPKVVQATIAGIEVKADQRYQNQSRVTYTLENRSSVSQDQCFATEAEGMAAAEVVSERRRTETSRARYLTEQKIVVGLKFSDLRIRQIQAKLDKANARVERFMQETRNLAEFSFIKDPGSSYGGSFSDNQVKAVLRKLFEECEEDWPVEGDEE